MRIGGKQETDRLAENIYIRPAHNRAKPMIRPINKFFFDYMQTEFWIRHVTLSPEHTTIVRIIINPDRLVKGPIKFNRSLKL